MDGEHQIAPESPFALLSDEELRAWYAYMKVTLRLQYEMNRQLRAEHGLSLADFDILVALISDGNATLTMSGLATRVGWERSRVSHQVRRMAGRGLLTADTGAPDRRATAVSLTDAGRTALAAASPSHIAMVRKVFLGALDAPRLRDLAASLEDIYEELIEHGTLPRPVDHP
jgi:DNA-binding MarR family transcriptional regulator